MNIEEKRDAGFTLLELLIVISIIAILSVALVVVLDPAETLRKSRDAQRISDMTSMKTALGLYLTSTTTPQLAGTSNTACKTTPASAYTVGEDYIYYSYPNDGADITDVAVDGATFSVNYGPKQVTTAANPLTDGTGWIPVNFDTLVGGSPISNLPIDPVNTVASAADVRATDYVYRYACSVTPLAFEIDAVLESTAYTSSDNKLTKDGGNSSLYYEVGTNLKILGAGGSAALDF